MVQQLNESHTHVARLECEIKSLKEEKLKQEYQNHACVTRYSLKILVILSVAISHLLSNEDEF